MSKLHLWEYHGRAYCGRPEAEVRNTSDREEFLNADDSCVSCVRGMHAQDERNLREQTRNDGSTS